MVTCRPWLCNSPFGLSVPGQGRWKPRRRRAALVALAATAVLSTAAVSAPARTHRAAASGRTCAPGWTPVAAQQPGNNELFDVAAVSPKDAWAEIGRAS